LHFLIQNLLGRKFNTITLLYLSNRILNLQVLQFAVVDIETTGGYAAGNGITEIAVFVTDGVNIVDTFYALLNPEAPIPPFIETLTGITNARVAGQPVFSAVAEELYGILKDKIFVAHNVNFDYSFLRFYLQKCGFELENKKLCTIRLARQIIPGLRSYGLGKLCGELGIKIENRHSASGDAFAAAELLHYFIKMDGTATIERMLKSSSGNMSLPPNVKLENINRLADRPGVYYFHDKKGKIIYVGKARDIKRRVKSHFSNNKPTKQKQEFLKKIYQISYKETATELMAFILEGIEIKRIWPEQNRSQKHVERIFGLYSYIDSRGYRRLFIEKKMAHIQPVYTFNHITEGYELLRTLIRSYSLCPHLCFLTAKRDNCHLGDYVCDGACSGKESPETYNLRVDLCLDELKSNLPSFAIIDKGLKQDESSCILVEEGKFTAMGYVSSSVHKELQTLKSSLTKYPDNVYVRSLIFNFAERHPHQILSFSGISFSR